MIWVIDMHLLVPLRKQVRQSDCLAACAAMVLDFLGETVDYRRLLRLLDIDAFGATHLGFDVVYGEATFSVLAQIVTQGAPVIVFVDTHELSYWDQATNHAIVVVGIEDDYVLVNDPAFDDVARPILAAEFELAWLNADSTYAVIGPQAVTGKS
jgi:ABC-type bacteriocin/lantibiotic exporter with double-glycine peptidase domain